MRRRIRFVPRVREHRDGEPTLCGNCGLTVPADQTTVVRIRRGKGGKPVAADVRCTCCGVTAREAAA